MTFRRMPPVGGDGTCVRLTGLDVIAAASRKPNVLFGSLGGDLVVRETTSSGEISWLNEGGGRGSEPGQPAADASLFVYFFTVLRKRFPRTLPLNLCLLCLHAFSFLSSCFLR